MNGIFPFYKNVYIVVYIHENIIRFTFPISSDITTPLVGPSGIQAIRNSYQPLENIPSKWLAKSPLFGNAQKHNTAFIWITPGHLTCVL